MPTLTTSLAALALTIAVESPVLWLLARRSWRYTLLVGLLVNVATQPPATWLVLGLGWPLLLVEGLVWAVESVLLGLLLELPLRRAVLVAGVANLASALIGLLLF